MAGEGRHGRPEELPGGRWTGAGRAQLRADAAVRAELGLEREAAERRVGAAVGAGRPLGGRGRGRLGSGAPLVHRDMVGKKRKKKWENRREGYYHRFIYFYPP